MKLTYNSYVSTWEYFLQFCVLQCTKGSIFHKATLFTYLEYKLKMEYFTMHKSNTVSYNTFLSISTASILI